MGSTLSPLAHANNVPGRQSGGIECEQAGATGAMTTGTETAPAVLVTLTVAVPAGTARGDQEIHLARRGVENRGGDSRDGHRCVGARPLPNAVASESGAGGPRAKLVAETTVSATGCPMFSRTATPAVKIPPARSIRPSWLKSAAVTADISG